VKQDKAFPLRAIKYCCDAANIPFSEITDIFVGWHPRFYISQSDKTLNDALQNRGKLSYLTLNELATLSNLPIEDVSQSLFTANSNQKIHFVDHHKAHVANVFFHSGFNQADFLILDGFGEITCGISGVTGGNTIDVFRSYPTPHSLGLFYAAFTDFLGFKPYSDEWKVMALSSLGNSEKYYPFIRSLIKVKGLDYEVDLSYFEYYLFFTPRFFSKKLCDVLGDPLPKGEEPSQRDCDIVAAVQRVVEETVFEMLNTLHGRTGNKNLALSGGFFMNSSLNGKVHEHTPYVNIFLGGSPDDSGISIGSSLYGLNYVLNDRIQPVHLKHNYFGRTYSDDEVLAELKRRKIRYSEVNHLPSTVARLVRSKKIVGFFQGKSEFGQRALGNRSILADPTYADIKDIVNATIKYRESFRPFAPSILKERQGDVFEVDGTQDSYFMEKVFRYRPNWKDKVPAVVHFDGTGRLQTVDKEVSPLFYEVIEEFEKLSGVPLLLNTSLNINGMPLVESPADALDCFYQSGLDALVLHNYLIEK
jgi:carbamoyltransferase